MRFVLLQTKVNLERSYVVTAAMEHDRMASFRHGASDWSLGSSLVLCGVDGSQVHCGLQEV